MDDAVQKELLEAFPIATFGMTIRGVREGIVLADDFAQSHPAFASPVGIDIIGQLRRVGIMFRLNELCTKGDLPFKSSMPKMERANWHQLELRSGKFFGHLTRTDDELAFPVDRPSRQDERLRNTGDLFLCPTIVPLTQAVAEAQRMTAWLTHRVNRKGELQHLCWAVPAADVDEWLGFVNITKVASADLPVSAASVSSTPDPREKMRFRDHIEAAKSQKDSESSSNANDN